eukprot:scaffold23625_cov137-Cylindrotheca_fusiformis.AAC.5
MEAHKGKTGTKEQGAKGLPDEQADQETDVARLPAEVQSDVEGGEEVDASEIDDEEKKERELKEAARYAALRNHRIRFEDAIDPDAERVREINKNDIVFGRGRGYQNHPGNLRMRKIIEKFKTRYHSLKRQQKREMVEAVYKEIVEDGARFLKKVEGEEAWVKVDVPVALQKVSHTLRCRKNTEKQVTGMAITPPDNRFYDRMNSADGVAGRAPLPHNASAGRFENPAMGMGLLPASNQLNFGLEAQRMAALQGFTGLATGMSSMMPGSMLMPQSMDYYNMIRRDQLIRETMLFQQMGDTYWLDGAQSRALGNIPNSFAGGRGFNQSFNQPGAAQREDASPDSKVKAKGNADQLDKALFKR